ncbi:hypothetical protein B0J13DRAFT_227531 [Dactylonectria estremocensis]|uniref:Secreted protein n=1 Tax=Dactylonectria estremocensis TaxID=1079267 RepID=A0A9P9F7Q2_9HYPO|nr:hypothetical protein B0J13DRAFT_227531 [Dactylonectria estremocensis]
MFILCGTHLFVTGLAGAFPAAYVLCSLSPSESATTPRAKDPIMSSAVAEVVLACLLRPEFTFDRRVQSQSGSHHVTAFAFSYEAVRQVVSVTSAGGAGGAGGGGGRDDD